MFPFINSTNPFSQFPSVIHLSPPPFTVHEGDNIVLHQHYDPLAAHREQTNASVVDTLRDMIVSTNHDMNRLNNGEYSDLRYTKKPGKKDRHSKVITAQGPRDRRVRLSIGIARKFFDLQDRLGYDKASKTIDWLLTKSKAAIEELELVHMKDSHSGASKSLCSTSECEEVSGTNQAAYNVNPQLTVSKKKPLMIVTEEKQETEEHKDALYLLARESRAKARAKARERTREKLCSRNLKSKELHCTIDQSHNESSSSEKLVSHGQRVGAQITHDLQFNEVSSKDMIEESIMISRKLNSSPTYNFQQNLIISKDVISNSSNSYFPTMAEQWDMSKFMTNVNPQTALDICSKPWEVYNNHFQH